VGCQDHLRYFSGGGVVRLGHKKSHIREKEKAITHDPH